jgi:Zn-dependent protease with chaperone function
VGTIKISESDRPFGMMMGIPGRPQLFLSRGLYNSFTPDEMEYVVLHEAGHYALAHSVKELLLGLVLLIVGVFLLKRIGKPILGLLVANLLGLVFGVGMIRFGAFNELEADNYSATRMTNPEGMITATEKFRGYYGKSLTQTDNKILQWMFYRGNPYDNRIKMAKDEISRRNLL